MSKSTLILPRYETPDPPGVVGTYGDRVIRWAKRELGVTLGPWQAHVVRKMLRYDREGDLIAHEALISTGRQNGKSIIVRSVIGWMLDEGRCLAPFRDWTHVLAAAHDAKQARIIYEGVYADLSSIPRMVEASRGGRFGRTVKLTELFGIRVGALSFDIVTSQPGAIRGKSAGLIAWDEMLIQRDYGMHKALYPALSAQRSPLMLYTSTAGAADSLVLRGLFARLVRQASGDDRPDPHFYGAWWQASDPGAGLDWEQVRQANPALDDGRLSREFIEGEYGGPPDIFRQERLNHWIETRAPGAFAAGAWAACRVPDPLPDADAGPLALAVDVQPGWERATVAVAAMRDDGRVGVELVADLRGTPDVPVSAAQLVAAIHDFPALDRAVAIAYDAVSGAASALRRDADETGLPYDELRSGAVISACMDVAELVQSARLAVDDPLIDAQIAGTARRYVGTEGLFRYGRAASTGPIDAVMAMTFAAHAIQYRREGLQIFLP